MIEVRRDPISAIHQYADIPSAFNVYSVFDVIDDDRLIICPFKPTIMIGERCGVNRAS